MLHGINNTFLYAAKKITAQWRKGDETIELRGTGFFLKRDDALIFVTNRHVVEPGYSNAQYKGFEVSEFRFETFFSGKPDEIPRDHSEVIIENWQDFIFHSNPHNDVACLKTFKPKKVNSSDTIIINQFIPYEFLATDEWITSKLSVCDTIAYPGFPEWYDRQNNTPIFRMGTIASDPRLNYSCFPGAPDASRIAYEGFSSGGASGSPVFAIQRGFPTGDGISAPENFYREVKLIGINAGHFNDQKGHSGISYLYKSSAIHDIID